MFFFFFFQAEDGIRDRNVTGVQTCALPISEGEYAHPERNRTGERMNMVLGRAAFGQYRGELSANYSARRTGAGYERSEERRVGKECRSGWWAEDEKKRGKKGERKVCGRVER